MLIFWWWQWGWLIPGLASWTCLSTLTEDGIPVQKHVAGNTYHELYFTVFYGVHLLIEILNQGVGLERGGRLVWTSP